ncbi:activator of 90 kDa heat shock protein ATPase homolog 1-like [Eriocheir sinensis]|uniref:activator of 90 kDa heat shock protein ATPase homolog 1-like n=1 Tax=Eriocheir sinensis TaxID=95602 RepID=UPI0021C76AE2|nr:activator of 90 kDa heat shock protein ATPase homolog 1-like [Eriocheir sinensis]
MAKWGEGDPRWIVEERPDATNVNNWHWSEKNASGWSKAKLKSLFEGLQLEDPNLCTVTIKEMTKCEGEATASNRKGKLIFFYEWVLTMDWSACLLADPKRDVKGTLEIPNLSEENDPHEIDVTVVVTAGGSGGDAAKEFIRKKGIVTIQSKIKEYIDTLKQEYATDLIKPTKGQAVTKQTKTIVTSTTPTSNTPPTVNSTANEVEKMDLGVKIRTSQLTLNQTFKCTADELYRALTQREMVAAFTRGDVKLEVEKGGKFEFFGGNISGEFEELVPNKRIVQKWRFKSWPSGHYSKVTLEIDQKDDCTEIQLTQTSVPASELEKTREGWRNYYWESIKRTFGFGAILL